MDFKKIILLSTIVILGALTLGQAVYADSPTLSMSPATASKVVGTSFNVSVKLNPQGNKVCVVKGTLNLNALTCRGITVASGLMAQTTPTCSKPNFLLGIPKCTTSVQNLITVSVRGNIAGKASASLSGAKVIGVGVVIASTINLGTYEITEAVTPFVTPSVSESPEVSPETQEVKVSPIATPEKGVPVNAQPASLSRFFATYCPATESMHFCIRVFGIWRICVCNIFWILLIILIILCIVLGIYYFFKKKKK